MQNAKYDITNVSTSRSHADSISLPSLSHTTVLSGNIFPQILCSLLTASLVNKASWPPNVTQEEKRRGRGMDKRGRDATQQKNLACHFQLGA